MRVVVADATPLHYLILVDAIQILPHLFRTVHIPAEVESELKHIAAPATVKTWMQRAPDWLTIHAPAAPAAVGQSLEALDSGERAAILLAKAIKADPVLIDERAGAAIARTNGFEVTGTLGLLDRASRRIGFASRHLSSSTRHEFPLCAVAYGTATSRRRPA